MTIPGTIAYCSRESDTPTPCFAAQLAAVAALHPGVKIVNAVTNDIASGRNHCVSMAEGDWIWFIDTDMMFAPQIIQALLRHGVDAVQPLVLKRHPPHQPVLWEDGPQRQNVAPRGRPRLVEVQSLGAGGTLYRQRVFQCVPPPWFEGILGVEDTNFAAKMRAAGIRMYCDLETPCGHQTPMVVWPEYRDGKWGVRYDAMNGQSTRFDLPTESRIILPQAVGVN